MKSFMKKMRENKKGFTLAELLVVVAIVSILVAISIPVFTAQLGKARRATNNANLRAAKAAAVAEYLTGEYEEGSDLFFEYDTATGELGDDADALPNDSYEPVEIGSTDVSDENVYNHICVEVDGDPADGGVTLYAYYEE